MRVAMVLTYLYFTLYNLYFVQVGVQMRVAMVLTYPQRVFPSNVGDRRAAILKGDWRAAPDPWRRWSSSIDSPPCTSVYCLNYGPPSPLATPPVAPSTAMR